MAGDPGYAPAGAKILDVTGVFCVSCRHIFICPNGVVDFQKGERYESLAPGGSKPDLLFSLDTDQSTSASRALSTSRIKPDFVTS